MLRHSIMGQVMSIAQDCELFYFGLRLDDRVKEESWKNLNY